MILHPKFIQDHFDNAKTGYFSQGSRVLLSKDITKKILYKEIEWNKLYEEDKIDTLPLNTLKEYLQKNNLYLYGKKDEIVRRICEHFERVD